jgi:hypothetical protein
MLFRTSKKERERERWVRGGREEEQQKEFMSMLPGSLATCLDGGGGGHGCDEVEEAEEELVR